jgi:UDP-N-acetylmuramoyl-tripeptide--D-alanyl-D-alanine ligase
LIPLAIEDVRRLAPGELRTTEAGEVTGVTIDSRRVEPGDLFVAVGRGVDYVDDALSAGAAAAVVPGEAFAALAALAREVRGRSSARVVAVTGSTAKTSTKDILGALCSPHAPTVVAEGSQNNEIGLPLTLCRLEPETEIAIVEMGMRGVGQIAELCEIARPHAAVVTAIGPVHLELVGSVEGVARSKAELVAALAVDGVAVVPDDPLLDPFLRDDVEIHRVGAVDVELREDGAHVAFRGRRIRFPLSSRHQAQNALTAMTAYAALGLPLDRLQEGADRVELSRWRGEELELPGGGVAINDAYNANPTSVEAALRHLRERAGDGRATAVLGGMAELGAESERYHLEAAALAAELDIEVLAVGELARAYGGADWVPDADAAVERLARTLRAGDVVLVKASRAVGLEGVAPALANRAMAWSES